MTRKFFKTTLLGRTLQATLGLFTYAMGVYLTLQAAIGLGPWEVLAMGIAGKLGLIFGNATLGVSAVILIMDVLMKERIGIGTVLNTIICSKAVDLYNWLELVPKQEHLAASIAVMVAGMFTVAVGQLIYISTGLGCGPRDSFVIGVGKRLSRWPIGLVQNGVLMIVLLIGWLLGGPVGLGTLLSVVGLGATMQLVFRIAKFEPRKVQHENIIESFRKLKK
ncbi:MAG: hypothetical protein IKU72_04625 [Oscillospiraceae bacterium]|nr:hypothetical protein [Oscillospiraceae bacterium]